MKDIKQSKSWEYEDSYSKRNQGGDPTGHRDFLHQNFLRMQKQLIQETKQWQEKTGRNIDPTFGLIDTPSTLKMEELSKQNKQWLASTKEKWDKNVSKTNAKQKEAETAQKEETARQLDGMPSYSSSTDQTSPFFIALLARPSLTVSYNRADRTGDSSFLTMAQQNHFDRRYKEILKSCMGSHAIAMFDDTQKPGSLSSGVKPKEAQTTNKSSPEYSSKTANTRTDISATPKDEKTQTEKPLSLDDPPSQPNYQGSGSNANDCPKESIHSIEHPEESDPPQVSHYHYQDIGITEVGIDNEPALEKMRRGIFLGEASIKEASIKEVKKNYVDEVLQLKALIEERDRAIQQAISKLDTRFEESQNWFQKTKDEYKARIDSLLRDSNNTTSVDLNTIWTFCHSPSSDNTIGLGAILQSYEQISKEYKEDRNKDPKQFTNRSCILEGTVHTLVGLERGLIKHINPEWYDKCFSNLETITHNLLEGIKYRLAWEKNHLKANAMKTLHKSLKHSLDEAYRSFGKGDAFEKHQNAIKEESIQKVIDHIERL